MLRKRRWRPVTAPLLMFQSTMLMAQSTTEPAGGGLTVAPIQLSLADARRAVSTVVTNPGFEAITVQVRLVSWTMRGEEEVYAPAADVGFSPPMFRLEPHASQAVRVVAKAPPGLVERSYRLIVDQLPLSNRPGQLQLPVRMILPVFIEPAAGQSRTPEIVWRARYEPQGGRVVVTAANRGAVHARIVNLAADDGRGTITIARGLSGYGLAGQSRDWSYRPGRVPARLTITAEGGATPIRVTVPVEQ